MFRLVACLALLGQLHGLSLPQLVKIFGGIEAPIQGYPFLVNLRRGGRFICGGFLATPSCVITAAHCLQGRHRQLYDLTVSAQQQCLGDRSASDNVRHGWFSLVSPYYRPSHGVDSDVAIIRLRQPFNIPNESLPKIDFNELGEKANLTVLGWGMTSNYGHHWNQCLQAAHVGLVPQNVCRVAMRQPITSNMLCAIGQNGKDACQGDSGGPLLQSGRPVGVVSWGYECGGRFPGVYTRLSSSPIKHWLQSLLSRYCRV
ncbi:chymotrypsin-1 [Drosophila madeirensis]|uniref:trypsin n=1 Tax=Drosophila madeirensis TaxID=30013 RepID=A0AAU9FMF1_DROMD